VIDRHLEHRRSGGLYRTFEGRLELMDLIEQQLVGDGQKGGPRTAPS
jgi:hypothetical protein